MSKNLTRKGLALGAIVALGSSLFAGAPAFAGVESGKISLYPAAGSTTTYTSIAGAYFDLSTEIDPTIKTIEGKSDLGKLTYLVGNPGAAKLSIDLKGSTNGSDTWSNDNIQVVSGDTADFAAGPSGAVDKVSLSTKKFFAIQADPATHSTDSNDLNTLRLTTTSDATDTVTVTVQAFIDDNGNGLIDTYDLTSPVRTVTFVPTASVSVTPTISSAVIGSTTLQGRVVFGNSINTKSLAGQVKIGFFRNGSAQKMVPNTTVDTVDLAWNTDGYLTNSGANLATVASADNIDKIVAATYTAKAYFGTPSAVLGSASNAVAPVAGTNASVDAVDNVLATGSANVDPGTASSTATTSVRTGHTGDIVFTSSVKDGGAALEVAGITVKVTLTKGATFTSGHEVTAGSAKLTSTSGAVSYETLTDADGEVSITAKSNKGTKDDIFVVTVEALESDGTFTATTQNTVTFADATAADPVITSVVGLNANLKVVRGSTYNLNVKVSDNFGQPWTAASHRVSITSNSNAGENIAYYPALASGAVTQAIADNATADGSYTVSVQLQKLVSTTWTNVGSAVTVGVATNSKVAAAVTATSSSTVAVATVAKAYKAADLRVDGNSATQASIGYGTTTTHVVSGTVTDSTGAAVAGAVVNLTGAGVAFVVNENVYTVGSATVNANASGEYSVEVYSNAAGKFTITATSGAATKAVVIEYSGVTTIGSTNVLTITGGGKVVAGARGALKVKVADSFNNPIKDVTVTFASNDPAVDFNTATATTDATGVATVIFTTNQFNAGVATVTATVTRTDDATKKLTQTASVLVGVSAKVTKAATSSATVKNALGATIKVVRGSKSTTKVATSNSQKVSVKGGTGSVKVYVNSILVATKK